MDRPVDAVIGFLEAELARGTTHVFLDQEARDGLRELGRRVREGQAAGSVRPAVAVKADFQPPAASPVVAESSVRIEGESKEERLASLRRQAENWSPARSLGTLRETMVFATGNPDARIMLVGEAPGHEEERRLEPFVGPAGRKLDDILRAMGFTRQEVYISNIVKFRPATLRQTTNNRKPDSAEIASCLPFVRAEVGIVRPACVIALGATAAEGLLGKAMPVAAMRGAWHEFEGVPVRVTYHPSYLLRSDSDLSAKRALWEDMLAVMDRLEMPVSDKQRSFFLPKG